MIGNRQMIKSLTKLLIIIMVIGLLPVISNMISMNVYASENLINNGDFSNGTGPWVLKFANGGSATLTTEDGWGKVNVTTGSSTGDVMFRQTLASTLVANTQYTYSFTVKSVATKKFDVVIRNASSSIVAFHYALYMNVTEQTFTYTYTPTSDQTNAIFELRLGVDASDVWVDNVMIYEGTELPTPTPTPSQTPTPTPSSSPSPTPTPTDGAVADIIIDNADDSACTFGGSWTVSTSTTDYYGTNYRHDGDGSANPDEWTKFTPNIITAGRYDVYLWWSAGTNRATAVPLEISYDGGTDIIKTVNQQTNGGKWVYIGNYNFAAGTSGYVKISASCAGYTIADAVKFVNNPQPSPTPTPGDVPIASITMDPVSLSIWKDFEFPAGRLLKSAVTITPANATVQTLSWSSDNEAVAAVNENGNITLVGVGTANITSAATDGSGESAAMALTVTEPQNRPANQKLNLPPVGGGSPRLTAQDVQKDLGWPENVGEGQIALWSGNKTGAYTMTVDDSISADFDKWKKYTEDYGFPYTFFVMTDYTHYERPNNDINKWRDLTAAGESVQSHTRNHYDNTEQAGLTSAQIIDDFAFPIKAINQSVYNNENKTRTLAHSYGTYTLNNLGEFARRFYIAARGVSGQMNEVGKVDYSNVGSISIAGGTSITNLTNSVNKLNDPTSIYYGGWSSFHCHGLDYTLQANSQLAALLGDPAGTTYYPSKVVGYFNENVIGPAYNQGNGWLWVDHFDKVAMYGQERDTATLTVSSVDENHITYTLTDEMDDTMFDFPLTVKFKVDPAWTDITAVQDYGGGMVELDIKVVMEGSNKYVMVETVPDRGTVTLNGYLPQPVAAPSFSVPSGTYNTPQAVTITCAIDEAAIRYTTDGSIPTESSPLYDETPVRITATGTTTLTAKAFKSGWLPSELVNQSYTINSVTVSYQPGVNGPSSDPLNEPSTSMNLFKTAQNFRNDLSVRFNSDSLWLGNGKAGNYSDLWLYLPQLIGSSAGQIPANAKIVNAKLVMTLKGVSGNQNQPRGLKLYQIIDPDAKGAPYFGSSGIRNGLDFQYRDHRPGRNIKWTNEADDITGLFEEVEPVDNYEFVPSVFLAEGYAEIRLDVTDSIKSWLSGDPNQGWFLRGDHGDQANLWAYGDGIEFYGATATEAGKRPKLEITYLTENGDNLPPEPVIDLTVTLGNEQVQLNWINPLNTDFNGVLILRKTGVIPGDPSDGTVVYDGQAGTTLDNQELFNGKSYYYAVFTYNQLRNYSLRTWIKAIPGLGTGIAPNDPSGLIVSLSGNTLSFNWTDNSGNENWFVIEQQEEASGTWVPVAYPEANQTSLTARPDDPNFGLKPNTAYQYRIKAVNAFGDSGYVFNTIGIMTLDFPIAPTNLAWTIISAGRVNLSWTDTATNETGYRVELCRNDVGHTVLRSIDLPVDVNSAWITGLTPGTEYLIKVVAVNSSVEAAACTDTIITTADPKGELL